MVHGYLVAATTHLLDDLDWVKAFCPGDLLATKIAMKGVHRCRRGGDLVSIALTAQFPLPNATVPIGSNACTTREALLIYTFGESAVTIKNLVNNFPLRFPNSLVSATCAAFSAS